MPAMALTKTPARLLIAAGTPKVLHWLRQMGEWMHPFVMACAGARARSAPAPWGPAHPQ